MALSATDLARFQRRLAISTDESVFTNDELNDYYDEAGDSLDGAMVLALRDLVMSAARLHDYTAGQTSEKLSQVRANLKDMLTYYEDRVQRSGNQVAIVGMRSVPPRFKEIPAGEQQPDVKNRRHNIFLDPYDEE